MIDFDQLVLYRVVQCLAQYALDVRHGFVGRGHGLQLRPHVFLAQRRQHDGAEPGDQLANDDLARARGRSAIRTRPEQLMLSLGKTARGAKPSQTNRRGCACKRNPVLRRRAALAEAPQNPRARTGRGFDARALHAWNK